MTSDAAAVGSQSNADDPWVVIQRIPDQFEATLMEGYLREAGIECVLETVFFSQEPTNFGLLGEYRLHVRKGQLEAAARLLEERPAGVDDAELGDSQPSQE